MASKKNASAATPLALTDTSVQASEQARAKFLAGGGSWASWTPELRAQADALAAAKCAAKGHPHKPEYGSCMGCKITTGAYVRYTNGGPSSAEKRAGREAKAAAKAALVPAVASVPVVAVAQAPALAPAAAIGFRPRGRKQAAVATPANVLDLNALKDPESIRQAIAGLVARYKEVGGKS